MTPATAFNLLDEPWIPVCTTRGDVREVSLADVLLNAGDYVALSEPSPPNLVALHRLLLAILHRALTTHHGKWTDKDRARWFLDGLPQAPIRAYLEQWRDRFWLFHPTQPFMQVAALAEAEETRDKLKAGAQVELGRANGNTPVMFDHSFDDAPQSVSCAAACRNILGLLQFTPGGLVKTVRDSDKAGALANTAAVVPLGSNLAESLLLALHPFDARGDDLPSWERFPPTITTLLADPTLASGPNDRYTRLSRAVLLVSDGDTGQVRRLRFAAGIALNEDPNAPDPMACYRVNREGKPIRVSFSEGRSIWRDLPSLVPDPSRSKDIPAAVLEWAANLHQALGRETAPMRILTAGLASDQAKLLRWRTESIELPGVLLVHADAGDLLRMQVRFAEDMYFALSRIYGDFIAQTMPDPEHKDTRARARSIVANGPAAATFFSAAERALPRLMKQIASGDIDAADRDWKAALQEAAHQSWAAVRRTLGDTPAALRSDALTWPRFRGLLKSLVQPAVQTVPATQEISA